MMGRSFSASSSAARLSAPNADRPPKKADEMPVDGMGVEMRPVASDVVAGLGGVGVLWCELSRLAAILGGDPSVLRPLRRGVGKIAPDVGAELEKSPVCAFAFAILTDGVVTLVSGEARATKVTGEREL